MYHSCSVEYRDSQRWALSKGQTGTEGHKSLETGNHSLEPSWGIALGTKAKARRVGFGLAFNDSLTDCLASSCGRAELAWLHWRDPTTLSLFTELFCLSSCGRAAQKITSLVARRQKGLALSHLVKRWPCQNSS